jgi:heme oxygenase
MTKQSSEGFVETPAESIAMQQGLVVAMRDRTRPLHTRAERSGIIAAILAGQGTVQGYKLFLRNLLPAYQHMEQGLERKKTTVLACVAQPGLYRAAAIEADLLKLEGANWQQTLRLLPEGERYAQRVAVACEGDGTRLIGHAYARYLGDLSGGQILKRLLARSLLLEPQALSFYDFPEIPDADAFKSVYRKAIDDAAGKIADVAAVIDEALVAFELNIDLSEAVAAAAPAAEKTAV